MNGQVSQLLGDDMGSLMETAFVQMRWAEDEIDKALRRHPDAADVIWHSFKLLQPTHELMRTEFVMRAHCRELLDRTAFGEDTRTGTAAEVVLMISDTSKIAPLNTTVYGLAGRMWTKAGFDGVGNPFADTSLHYEAIRASEIDDLEAEARRKLSVADRTVGHVECTGSHHGEPVVCRFAPAEVIDVPDVA